VIVDTDILIWHMRGNAKAQRAIDRLGVFSISAITYMKIVQGVRNKKELRALRQFIQTRGVHCIPVDSEIASRAMFLLEEYSLSYGMEMSDALIAATAENQGETLYTANASHYDIVPNLSVKVFRPE
jgi:predicted nucleic acid-binding protein